MTQGNQQKSVNPILWFGLTVFFTFLHLLFVVILIEPLCERFAPMVAGRTFMAMSCISGPLFGWLYATAYLFIMSKPDKKI